MPLQYRVSVCRYTLLTMYSVLWTELSPPGERCMPKTLPPRVTSSVPKLFGRTVGNLGRSLEPSRVVGSPNL